MLMVAEGEKPELEVAELEAPVSAPVHEERAAIAWEQEQLVGQNLY